MYVYCRIIYRLGQRNIVSSETDQQRAAAVKKQVLQMLVVNTVVFFMLHIPVRLFTIGIQFRVLIQFYKCNILV